MNGSLIFTLFRLYKINTIGTSQASKSMLNLPEIRLIGFK